MPCGCSTYECLEAWVNPCNAGTYIGITADETATWIMRLEFNGAWKQFSVSVTDGQQVSILTSLLNENYKHELRIYSSLMELLGCYWLKTSYTSDVADAPVSPILGAWQWATLTVDGNTVTDDVLSGEISPIMWMDGNSIEWEDNGITHDPETETLNFSAIGGYTGEISFQYRILI